jgi:hypothetical protein
MSINAMDIKSLDYPYMRLKTIFFMVLFVLLVVEYGLDWLYFTHIDTQKAVSCCSVIYGKVGGGIPFGLDSVKLLMLFYLLFVLLLLTTLNEMAILSIVVSLLFGFISYYSVVYFFGTYIYELPTHLCPFCMLQDHYYYVGYVLWGFLLLGVFLAIDTAIMQRFFKQPANSLKKVSLLLLSMFVLLCSSYVAVFYFKNGVFL